MSSTPLRRPLRSLRRSWRLTIAALLCLALGVGATSAMATLVRSVLYRPLPFPEAERLVRIWREAPEQPHVAVSYPLLEELTSGSTSFERVEATARARLLFFGEDGGRRVEGEAVTPGYFDLIGVEPFLGRLPTPDEHAPDARGILLLSHDAWGTVFGYGEDVLGSTVRTDEGVFEVIGVLPAGFTGTVEEDAGEIEFWLPIDHYVSEERRVSWAVGGIWVLARLAEQVGLPGAQAELASLSDRLAREQPETEAHYRLHVEPMGENWRTGLRRGSFFLAAAALGLALVAALNVATLLVARAMERRREQAVQRALGASAARLARETAVETGLVVVGGGLLGAALATGLLPWLMGRATVTLPDYVSLQPDLWVVVSLVAVLGAVGLVAGLAPALAARKADPMGALREGGRSGTPGPGARRLRAGLVVAQVALTAALAYGSIALIRSWDRLASEDLGFRRAGVGKVAVFLGPEDAPEEEDLLPAIRRVRDAVAGHPGVEDVALLWPTVPIWSPVTETLRWAGMPEPLRETGQTVGVFLTDHALFDFLDVELLRGRGFHPDEPDRVAILSQGLSEKMGGVDSVVGRSIELGDGTWRVVGVAEDVRFGGAQEDPLHAFEVYLPLAADPQRLVSVFVLTEADPDRLISDLGRTIASVAPSSALDWAGSIDHFLGERYKPSRFAPLLLGIFGAAALGITGIGLFALLSDMVHRSRGEIGIRKALGATPGRVAARVAWQAWRLTAVGLAAGGALAILASRFLEPFLYGVEPLDEGSFLLAGATLLGLAALAGWLPSRRAAGVEPMTVLREDG